MMKRIRVSTGIAALLMVGAAMLQGQAMSQPVPPSPIVPAPVPAAGSGTDMAFTLHGNTPSMAWSPDSRRLAVNAAYTYFGWDEAIAAHRGELGVYVVDAGSGAKVHVGADQGYHPLWLDASTVAWGHSAYEDGQAGLFVSPADKADVRRVGTFEGVHHTLPAKRGGVLYYSGFPDGPGWTYADVSTGATKRAFIATDDSWQIPSEQVLEQCVQQVGEVRLTKGFVDGALRWMVQVGPERVALQGEPYAFGVGDVWLPDAHKGVVRACLSPDGKRVAWFVSAGTGEVSLRIRALPH